MNLRRPYIYFFLFGDQSHLNMVYGNFKPIYLLKLNNRGRQPLRITITSRQGDSMLVIHQVKEEWETRDAKLVFYSQYVAKLSLLEKLRVLTVMF